MQRILYVRPPPPKPGDQPDIAVIGRQLAFDRYTGTSRQPARQRKGLLILRALGSFPEFSAGPPSKDLLKFVKEIKSHSNAPILDAGCGYGRNAIALATRGMSVVCVDQDLERLDVLARFGPTHVASLRESDCELGQLHVVLAQLGALHWPFRETCFAGIVCVHFLNPALFEAFRSSLVEGGCLYIETFGGQGGNYLALPKAGELHDLLWPDFHLPLYRERKVGPTGYDAVTVKLFARKR